MKKVFIIAILLLSCAGIKAQDKKKVDCKKFVSLISKAVFSDFVKFTKQLEYSVLDSSKGEDGSIFYFTKEPVIHGNSLACTTDKTGLKITLLTFTTCNEQNYSDLKKQLKQLMFVSSGKNKSNRPPVTESEDFEKDGLNAATAVRKEEGYATTYEFTFFKW